MRDVEMRGLDSPLDDLITNSGGKAPRRMTSTYQRRTPYDRSNMQSGRRGEPRDNTYRSRDDGPRRHDSRPDSRSARSEPSASDLGPSSMGVSGKKDARAVADDIHRFFTRNRDFPILLTIGHTSINQAVKGVAIASKTYFEGNLTFQPAFRDSDLKRAQIALYLYLNPQRNRRTDDNFVLKVAGNSEPKSVAGAIAGRVRDRAPVSLLGIGVDAVGTAVMAASHARLYLDPDNKDIKLQPEFHNIEREGGSVQVALKFNIFPVNA